MICKECGKGFSFTECHCVEVKDMNHTTKAWVCGHCALEHRVKIKRHFYNMPYERQEKVLETERLRGFQHRQFLF